MSNTTTTAAIDWLEALFSHVPTAEETAAAAAAAAAMAAESAAAVARVNKALADKSPNTCTRCNGSGNVGFRRAGGICFRCDGVGFIAKN